VKKISKQKGNFDIFCKTLTGKIEYDPPDPDFSIFRGVLKLKKDPKGENITDNNAMYRGAQLKGTDWLVGIILFCGNETKTMLNAYPQPYRKPN
jgi:hypothetical protein